MSDPILSTNPHLQTFPLENNRVRIENPYYNLKVEVNEKVLPVLDYFKTPHSVSGLKKEINIENSVIESLRQQFFLFDYGEAGFLEHGFFLPSPHPIASSLSWNELKKISAKESHYAIIGMPVDLGAEHGGSRDAPEMIREHFLKQNILLAEHAPVLNYELNRKYDLQSLRAFDPGNICYHPGEDLKTVGNRLVKLITECVKKNLKPLILGGDHSISWFAIEALAGHYDQFGIIQFDAHHDLYELTFHQRNQLDHGNVFAFSLKNQHVKSLLQVGLRTIENFEVDSYREHDARCSFVSSYQARHASAEEIFKHLDKNIPYYISFDIDCLVFPFYSESGTPVLGGLTYYKMLELFDYLSLHHQIIGGDFVELIPNRETTSVGAQVIARFMLQLILNDLPFTPII